MNDAVGGTLQGNTGVKLCECGCGQPAPIAAYTNRRMGYKQGEPVRFIHTHFAQTLKKHIAMKPCECGCGQLVANRFALGHCIRLGQPKNRRHFEPVEVRFWRWVDKSGDCWLWTGPRTGNGYGAISSQGKQMAAHRLSYVLAKGEIPPGMQVLHSCDNPLCVRPDHLSLGTLQENSADMVRKGRASKAGPAHPARGERNGGAILTEVQVRDIRRQSAAGARSKELAQKYGVTKDTIRSIAARRSWAHIEG